MLSFLRALEMIDAGIIDQDSSQGLQTPARGLKTESQSGRDGNDGQGILAQVGSQRGCT